MLAEMFPRRVSAGSRLESRANYPPPPPALPRSFPRYLSFSRALTFPRSSAFLSEPTDRSPTHLSAARLSLYRAIFFSLSLSCSSFFSSSTAFCSPFFYFFFFILLDTEVEAYVPSKLRVALFPPPIPPLAPSTSPSAKPCFVPSPSCTKSIVVSSPSYLRRVTARSASSASLRRDLSPTRPIRDDKSNSASRNLVDERAPPSSLSPDADRFLDEEQYHPRKHSSLN